MKRTVFVVSLVVMLTLILGLQTGQAIDITLTKDVSASVVQIIAADEGRGGLLIPKWSGSGTVISEDGLILTNCQVAFPKAVWDDPEFAYDLLIVALATEADGAAQPTYLAEVAQYDAALDLAVLRITQMLDGTPVDAENLSLPAVPLGDSDKLESASALTLWGYSGVGGEAIVSVKAQVSGFSSGRGIQGRAWIRMDASVEGGMSGGPAVNEDGELVGVPAVGAAQSADDLAHCRYIEDTNGDGVVDQNDACTPTGGSISTLRPVNLAQPLIKAASRGLGPQPTPPPGPTPGPTPTPGLTPQPTPSPVGGPVFGPVTFAEGETSDAKPVKPGTTFRAGIPRLYAFWDYQGMEDGWDWTRRWFIDGEMVVDDTRAWNAGESGNFRLYVYSDDGLPAGEYRLDLLVEGKLLQSATCTLSSGAPRPTPTPTRPVGGVQIYGQITDAYTGRGIPGAFFAVLQPGTTVEEFVDSGGDDSLIYSFGRADRNGYYRLSTPLARGEYYSLIIGAQGYIPILEDDVFVPEDTESPLELKVELELAT
ncbi:MAG: S1 family peptidase [Anaerolineae bacterium]